MASLDQLSPEQRQVVETWDEGLAVMAGAGSGKTTTLVVKCAELLKRKSDGRFAAVSFTEKSASDLRAKLSGAGVLEGQWVMTIHGLCGAILREHPREAGFDGEESVLAEGEAQILWERAIEQLWADDAPEEIQSALERLLARENRDGLWALLKRVRELYLFGAIEFLRKSADPDTQALAVLASFVIDRYDRQKRRRGALDFNDLELGADRALEHASVREEYQRRFDLVLVDEFQDTNPVQARIILGFARPDRSNLCVVGDPKQSIYRFRDADVSVFEEFCSRLPRRIFLTRNFRSRPGILEFTNQVCEKAFEASSMPYEPLVPNHEPGSFEPVVRLDVKAPQDLARWICSELARGVRLEDMALLLRKIRGNEKWLKALSAAGIPIAVGSGGLFWEDPRARELVAFLKWWDHPANSLSGAVFLRAPWVGIADIDLDGWVKQDPTWQGPFFSSGHPLARALQPLRGRVLRPGELLMSLLIDEKTESELGSALLALWHRVEELSSRGLDFSAVVAEVSLAVQERRREREVPPPRNQGQLSVLTLHGSKGLEFPHVILVDLGKKSRAANSPTLFWDRVRGAYLVRKDAEGERIDDPELEQWKSEERAKELAESKRVFYVALTRARERLVLACPELSEKEANYASEKVYTEDFWRGWIEVSGANPSSVAVPTEVAPLEIPKPLKEAPIRLDRSQFPVSRPRHSVTEWNLLSRCPRAYEWTYVRPKVSPAREASFSSELVHEKDAEITQRELGTEVHACLETGDYDRLDALEARAGADRFSAARVREWADSSPVMDPRIGSFRRAWAELAFEIPVEGETLVGSIDRVVESETRMGVVDFKVTRHRKTSEALLEAYRTQMELYRWALARLEGIELARIEATLINFSDAEVHEVRVEPGQLDVFSLAAHAKKIVRGEAGEAKPGALCEVCQFARICDRKLTTSF